MTAVRPWKYALFVPLALAGCTGMSGAPIPVSRGGALEGAAPDASRILRALQTDCLEPSAGTDEEKRQRRNHLVIASMTAVDMRYNAYERSLLGSIRRSDLGATLARQLRPAVGAGSDGEALSEAANTTSGAITGPRRASPRALLDQTFSALQSHMRAQRLHRRAVNFEHFALPYAQWNGCQALLDVVAYEQAGTLNAALAAMAESAREEERDAQGEADAAIAAAAVPSGPLATALAGYVYPEDRNLRPERIAVARRILAAGNLFPDPGLSVSARLSRILGFADPDREPDRRALVQGLVDDANVAETLKAPLRAALAVP